MIFPWIPRFLVEILEDVISYNATISSCQKADEWRMSLEILRAVAEAMVESNNITGWVASKKHNPVTPLLSEPSPPNCHGWTGNAAISACRQHWVCATHLFSARGLEQKRNIGCDGWCCVLDMIEIDGRQACSFPVVPLYSWTEKI